MCKGKKCCSVITVIMVILTIAAIIAIVYLTIKKFHLLEGRIRPMDEGFWLDEKENENDDVPYTTDQDFE